MKSLKLYKYFFSIIALAIICCISFAAKTFAEDEYPEVAFQVSPMNQKVVLTPGERYYGTFKITNPATSKYSFQYKATTGPFYVDETYSAVYENNGDYNQIVDWTTIMDDGGIIRPNETATVGFYIDVPADAPAGGQYVAISVSSDPNTKPSSSDGVALHAKYAIAHLIYAEVAGETIRGGEFTNIDVPSFLFSGNISATSSIHNTGNVHSDAEYTLQVFPLLSKEEVYTNEEDPMTNTILPDATRTTVLSWGETPSVGIFHVIYAVSFEGIESKVDKYVIICPLWLLFIILACLFVIIFGIFFGKKKER